MGGWYRTTIGAAFWLLSGVVLVCGASAAEPHCDYSLQRGDGAGFAVIVAVGPHHVGRPYSFPEGQQSGFQDPRSRSRRADVTLFLDRVFKSRYPNAETFQPAKLTKAELEATYARVKAHKPSFKKILLIVNAHGGELGPEGRPDGFHLEGDEGERISDGELGGIVAGTPTETALLACDAGAANLASFPGGVFGSSRGGDRDYQNRLYEWMRYFYSNPGATFPTCAAQFYDSWQSAGKQGDQASRYERTPWVGHWNAELNRETVEAGDKPSGPRDSARRVIERIPSTITVPTYLHTALETDPAAPPTHDSIKFFPAKK